MVTVNCEISYLLGRLLADTLLHYHQEQAGTPATARWRLHLQTKTLLVEITAAGTQARTNSRDVTPEPWAAGAAGFLSSCVTACGYKPPQIND